MTCITLCNPWTVAHQAPLSMEFSRQGYWSRLSFSYLPSEGKQSENHNHIKLTNLITWTTVQFSSVQSLSHARLFATPWIAAHQASLSITNSQSSLKLMSIQSVMPSSHLILCRPLLLLHPIPPASASSQTSQLFPWGGQSTGVSASA